MTTAGVHPDDPQPWWRLQRSDDAIVATAIHDGHQLRPAVETAMALSDAGRLREEDPFTGHAIARIPTHVIAHRSRFEVDLNRPPEAAVYRTPEQCWGLQVWQAPPDDAFVAESLRSHRAFYAMVGQLLDDVAAAHPRFVVLDVHSYNHRRDGADAAPTPQQDAPDINIGTYSMPRAQWAWLLDPLIERMRDFDFGGRRLDVRENVAFEGRGELTRFVHARYPGAGCAIAIEFKKFFMDEWSGQPDPAELATMQAFMRDIATHARGLLQARNEPDARPTDAPAHG
ncbi:N-formylglutamate amidohydrolase [Luteimonas sp. RIT-PG2_3]